MFKKNHTRDRERISFPRYVTRTNGRKSTAFKSSTSPSSSDPILSTHSTSSLSTPSTSTPSTSTPSTSTLSADNDCDDSAQTAHFSIDAEDQQHCSFSMMSLNAGNMSEDVDRTRNLVREDGNDSFSDEENSDDDDDYQRIIIEHDLDDEFFAASNENDVFGGAPRARNHRDEFIKFMLKDQMSKASSFVLEKLLRDIFGKSLPFTVQVTLFYSFQPFYLQMKSIWTELEDMKNQLIHSTVYTCNGCSHVLLSKNSVCTNGRCKSSMHPKKKGKTSSYSSIVRMGVEKQIKEVIEKNFEELIKKRNMMHNGVAVYPPEYVLYCESKEDFKEKNIILPITLTCDGARFKGDKANEYTPFLIRVEGIGGSNIYNHIIAAFHKGENGVRPDEFDIFTEKLVEEILEINKRGIALKNGYVVKLSVLSYLSDIKAMKIAGDIPNWMIKFGCNVCYIEGSKVRNFMSFNQIDGLVLRTSQGCFTDCAAKIRGFRRDGIPIIFIICTPNRFKLDTFHILSEGIEKKSLNGMSESTWKWAKKLQGRFDVVEDSLDKVKSYTHGTAILPYKSRNNATGVQISMICRISFPVSSFGNIFVFKSYAFYLMSFWALIAHHGNTETYIHLNDIMTLCGKLHIKCEPDYVSIKHHFAYCHLIEQWINLGADYDVKNYEKIHCVLQRSIHFRSTNNLGDMISRYLMARKLSYSDQLPGKRKTSLLNCLDIKSIQTVDQTSITQQGFDLSGASFWCRAFVFNDKTEKSLIFGSNYWEKSIKTCQNIVAVRRDSDNRFVFHEIRLFFELNGILRALTYEYVTEKGEDITKKLLKSVDVENRTVVFYCERLQEKFELVTLPFDKILYKKPSMIVVNEICSPATIVPLENDFYVTTVT